MGAILGMYQVWYVGKLAILVGDYGADLGVCRLRFYADFFPTTQVFGTEEIWSVEIILGLADSSS